MNCQHCGNHHTELVKQFATNGAIQVLWWCYDCNRNAFKPGKFVKLAGNPDKLTTINDYRQAAPPCVVCGATTGTEYHHFAPRHIFDTEAEAWPGAYVCRKCHLHWHETITIHIRTCPKCLAAWRDTIDADETTKGNRK